MIHMLYILKKQLVSTVIAAKPPTLVWESTKTDVIRTSNGKNSKCWVSGNLAYPQASHCNYV